MIRIETPRQKVGLMRSIVKRGNHHAAELLSLAPWVLAGIQMVADKWDVRRYKGRMAVQSFFTSRYTQKQYVVNSRFIRKADRGPEGHSHVIILRERFNNQVLATFTPKDGAASILEVFAKL